MKQLRLAYSGIFIAMLFIGCQPKQDNSAKEAFEKNSKTVLSYLDAFQNEDVDYSSFYSDDVILRGTGFGDKDTINLDGIKANDQRLWKAYDLKLVDDPLQLLPGVNQDTKLPDGSVRYYGNWKVTLPATDSTEAKSGILKLYESFDFDKDGKILYQQFYGDFGGLFGYLNSTE